MTLLDSGIVQGKKKWIVTQPTRGAFMGVLQTAGQARLCKIDKSICLVVGNP
jgi:hypothetical protein